MHTQNSPPVTTAKRTFDILSSILQITSQNNRSMIQMGNEGTYGRTAPLPSETECFIGGTDVFVSGEPTKQNGAIRRIRARPVLGGCEATSPPTREKTAFDSPRLK